MATVAVIGAGVFGSWCAWRLADAGHRVILVDAYGPANGRASSADHSRVIRAGYGGDAIYSRWATAAWDDWKWLSAQTGQTLVTRTGALFMDQQPGTSYLSASYDTLSSLRLRAEWLDPSVVAQRFPQISVTGLGPSLFEHDAGVIRARAAVQALVKLAVTHRRVEYRVDSINVDEDQPAATVRDGRGSRVQADIYVFACGPWLPQVLPRSLNGRIRTTRQEILHFGVPAGDVRFSVPQMPVWIDFASGVYGIPDMDARGFKVGIDRHGAAIDPDDEDRVVNQDVISRTRDWLAGRFPDLAGAPLVDSRVCQYENTSSGDFIIDRHPAWANVWIAGGGSGHGFKHGPSVARYLVDRIDGRRSPDPRFDLASKSAEPRRAVF